MLSRRNEAISQPHNYLLLELQCADHERWQRLVSAYDGTNDYGPLEFGAHMMA